MNVYLTRYESVYMKAKFYRMYQKVVAPGHTYLNSYGEKKSREKRVIGESGEEATNEHLVQDIIEAGSSIIPTRYPQLAKFFLMGKYRLNKFNYLANKVIKK